MKKHPSNFRRSPVVPEEAVSRATEHPLKICVVFDEDASARSADLLRAISLETATPSIVFRSRNKSLQAEGQAGRVEKTSERHFYG